MSLAYLRWGKPQALWEQYRDSPAAEDGISCQDCHMGVEPGKPSRLLADLPEETGRHPRPHHVVQHFERPATFVRLLAAQTLTVH